MLGNKKIKIIYLHIPYLECLCIVIQISIPMSIEFDELSLSRENPTEEMQSKSIVM